MVGLSEVTVLVYHASIEIHQRSVELYRPAGSIRGLLVSVLGELVRPTGGVAWTQTLIEVMSAFDVDARSTRQSIARLADQGWLTSEKVGRRTRWQLTPWGTDLLESGAQRIYGHGQTTDEWNGEWLLVMASVPEALRNLRYRLEVGFGWAGLGNTGQGVWLTPWTDREPEVARLLIELDIDGAAMFRSTMASVGAGTDLAARAWDLPAVADEYRAFLVEPFTATNAAAEVVALVHRWRRFPLLDPALPAELVADDWPGPAAAARFESLRTERTPAAQDWWLATESRFAA